MPHPLRAELGGFFLPQDRLWRVEGKGAKGPWVAGFTEYNGEVTGCAPILGGWVRNAGGNAGYMIDKMRKKGFKVERVDETTENS